MAAKAKSKTKKLTDDAFSEVWEEEPSTVKKSGKTGEAKRKMKVAVALSKARAKGARIPVKKK